MTAIELKHAVRDCENSECFKEVVRAMNVLRATAVATLLLGITACSGNGTGLLGNNNPFGQQCNPGTSVQLARPSQGQTGVGSINSVEIVANGQNNTLYQTYQNWQLVAQDSFGNVISGGGLALVSDTGGPHPYTSDFYYSSSFPNLQSGTTYSIQLSESGCQGVNVGSFST